LAKNEAQNNFITDPRSPFFIYGPLAITGPADPLLEIDMSRPVVDLYDPRLICIFAEVSGDGRIIRYFATEEEASEATKRGADVRRVPPPRTR
jgi:hypothetical protein